MWSFMWQRWENGKPACQDLRQQPDWSHEIRHPQSCLWEEKRPSKIQKEKIEVNLKKNVPDKDLSFKIHLFSVLPYVNVSTN